MSELRKNCGHRPMDAIQSGTGSTQKHPWRARSPGPPQRSLPQKESLATSTAKALKKRVLNSVARLRNSVLGVSDSALRLGNSDRGLSNSDLGLRKSAVPLFKKDGFVGKSAARVGKSGLGVKNKPLRVGNTERLLSKTGGGVWNSGRRPWNGDDLAFGLGRRSLGGGALGLLEAARQGGAAGFHSGTQERTTGELVDREAHGVNLAAELNADIADSFEQVLDAGFE